MWGGCGSENKFSFTKQMIESKSNLNEKIIDDTKISKASKRNFSNPRFVSIRKTFRLFLQDLLDDIDAQERTRLFYLTCTKLNN